MVCVCVLGQQYREVCVFTAWFQFPCARHGGCISSSCVRFSYLKIGVVHTSGPFKASHRIHLLFNWKKQTSQQSLPLLLEKTASIRLPDRCCLGLGHNPCLMESERPLKQPRKSQRVRLRKDEGSRVRVEQQPEGRDLLCLPLKMKRPPAKEYRRPLGTRKATRYAAISDGSNRKLLPCQLSTGNPSGFRGTGSICQASRPPVLRVLTQALQGCG
ncbi:unnamed protein product [Rangifer tarandus platyrhynchus]|uniref:Uncharacterized protein n=1 Tax=Rangifer tarandus platyrhynchus TaxID=3082113 RepID=A0AC59ZVC9_RANTA